jgi:uncharacterized membrane protein YheB (UPF0754 family)
MNYWLIFLIPVISAFIGWITNRVAIKMLFHPRKPKYFLGMRFQGIFPKRQQQFADKLGKTVSRQFLSYGDIQAQISDPSNLSKIMPLIENHIDEFLRVKLTQEIPMVGMFIGDKTVALLKQALMKEIETLFPIVLKQYAINLKDQLDIEQIVTNKVAAFSSDKLEELLYEIMSKEFRFVEIIGAVIGFVIGVVQVILTYYTS